MLWAITALFNPARYKSRLANYRIFRQHLSVPLLAVELSFGGSFELHNGDAQILVQLAGGDVLWQKERLLNVALRALPSECEIVAWLDCDVIFASDDWPERARRALEVWQMVQLFREQRNLAQGTTDALGAAAIELVASSAGYKIATGTVEPDDLRGSGAFLIGRPTTGLAWAARRALLDRHGFYDACIAGGVKTMICAGMGKFEDVEEAYLMNSRQVEHYRRWGYPFFADVSGRVGYVDGVIYHLWHGDLKDRQYHRRREGLRRFEFDPFTDIAIGASGAWRWDTDKRELHDYVRRYFESRNEDGR